MHDPRGPASMGTPSEERRQCTHTTTIPAAGRKPSSADTALGSGTHIRLIVSRFIILGTGGGGALALPTNQRLWHTRRRMTLRTDTTHRHPANFAIGIPPISPSASRQFRHCWRLPRTQHHAGGQSPLVTWLYLSSVVLHQALLRGVSSRRGFVGAAGGLPARLAHGVKQKPTRCPAS
jgi:hypothetical protein